VAPQGNAAVSWNSFLSIYLPAAVLGLGTGIALPAVPTLAKSFAVSFEVASGVMTAFLLGTLAAAIPAGWLIDRFGYRRVILAGPLITATMAFLTVVAQTFPELLVLRFFTGFAAQLWLMGRLTAISHDTPPRERGRQISWMMGMDNSGKLTGPLVGGFVASAWGTRAPFLVYGALALLALVPVVIFANSKSLGKDLGEKTSAPARKLSLREIVMPRLVYFGVALFAGLTRGPVQADLLHLYAAFVYQLGPQQIGYLATAAAALSWPISFVAGWILDRFGRKRTMVPGFGGVAIAMTALAASAFWHFPLFWYIVLFLFGVSLQSLTGGSIQTVGADVAPPEARGTFLGLWRFTGQAGAALSPIIFAFLAAELNYGTSFLFTAASAGVVAFLLIRFVPETRTSG
jgi:MFS family permease